MNNPEQKSRSEIQKTEHGAWKSRLDDTKNMHSQTHSSFSFPLMSARDHFNQSFRSGCKSDLRQGTLLDVPCNFRAYKLCTDFHNLHRSPKFQLSCWNGSYGGLLGIYLEVFDRFIAFIRLIRKKNLKPGIGFISCAVPALSSSNCGGSVESPQARTPHSLSLFSPAPFPSTNAAFSCTRVINFFCEVGFEAVFLLCVWSSSEVHRDLPWVKKSGRSTARWPSGRTTSIRPSWPSRPKDTTVRQCNLTENHSLTRKMWHADLI